MSSEARIRGSGSLTSGERSSGQLHTSVTPDKAPVDRAAAAAPGTPPRQFIPTRKLSPAEFNTAMVHFYRGEVQRSNTWRNRLDTTTNWAVLTAGATLSFVFSSPSNPHFVIPINSILVAIFLVMEARRYRYYEIWSSRVRVMETGYFAQMLTHEGVVNQEWADHLAADLLTPHFTISEWEAIGRRLRRNYLWIFALLALSWNLKVYLHPTTAYSFGEFLARATVGLVPGWMVFMSGVIFNVAVVVFAVATVRLREATGEVLPRHQFSLRSFRRVTDWTRSAAGAGTQRAASRRAKRARQRTRTATATGEFRKVDISEIPNKETVKEETIIR
jgi:uncharacterized membrane protein